MATAASDIIRLTDSYELDVQITESVYNEARQIELRALPLDRDPDKPTRGRSYPRVDVMYAMQRPRRYNSGWDSGMEPQYGSLDVNYLDTDDTECARASAAMLLIAADILDAEHRFHAEELMGQQQAHAKSLEEQLKAEEQRQEKRNKLKEELQWFVGHKFKLRRDGYKATVFGTIDRFTDTHVYTTSERGVRMDTRIEDINFFAVMYDGERRYTKVFEREPKRI